MQCSLYDSEFPDVPRGSMLNTFIFMLWTVKVSASILPSCKAKFVTKKGCFRNSLLKNI